MFGLPTHQCTESGQQIQKIIMSITKQQTQTRKKAQTHTHTLTKEMWRNLAVI